MKSYIKSLIDNALSTFTEITEAPEYIIEQPKDASHGDLSTNVAMLLSRMLKKNPRQIAQDFITRFEINADYISKVEIAGPGFINFKLTNAWVQDQLTEITSQGASFGKTKTFDGKKVTESNGEAFQYSGETLELLKQEKTNLKIKTDNEIINRELNLYFKFALIAMDSWTVNTAEIVKLSLENQNKLQKELAQLIGINQEAVSKRLKRAYFEEIQELNLLYREKIDTLIQ